MAEPSVADPSAESQREPIALLSIDAGIDTGWAFFEGDEFVIGGVSHEDYLGEQIRRWMVVDPDIIIIEPCDPRDWKQPRDLQAMLRSVMARLRSAFPQRREVESEEWKPMMRGFKIPEPVRPGRTQHERDAIRLGFYALQHPEECPECGTRDPRAHERGCVIGEALRGRRP